MKVSLNKKVRADELRLADVVKTWAHTAWNVATVKQIKQNTVVLFRPYVETADFSYTGGVVCYIGIEDYEIPKDGREYEVLERKDLK